MSADHPRVAAARNVEAPADPDCHRRVTVDALTFWIGAAGVALLWLGSLLFATGVLP